jgi:pilus assembly protein Flp/PilA
MLRPDVRMPYRRVIRSSQPAWTGAAQSPNASEFLHLSFTFTPNWRCEVSIGCASLRDRKFKCRRRRAQCKGLAARRGRENSAMRPLKQFLADDVGATAIEYALISSLIAITIIASLNLLGSQLSNEFSEVSSALK